eukprot:497164_1
MLTSKSKSTTSSTTKRRDHVKSLTSTLPTAESKTPESEESIRHTQSSKSVKKADERVSAPVIVEEPEEKKQSASVSTKKVKQSPLSKRAARVKEELNRNEIVSAVVLKADGSSEEIKYKTSSKEVNQILGGRPTIIGELEEISVIIVRSLNA